LDYCYWFYCIFWVLFYLLGKICYYFYFDKDVMPGIEDLE